MTRTPIAVALVLLSVVALGLLASHTRAQPPEEIDENGQPLSPERREARRLFAEASSFAEAEQWALAAQAWLRLRDYMQAHAFPRAVVAEHNICFALGHLPGRERDAIDACRRFLEGSNTPALTDDAEIRDFRSADVERIAELEARLGTAENSSAEEPAPPVEPSTAQVGSLSPIGPIVLGVGGAAMIASAIVGGVGLAQDGSLAAMCMGGNCPESARPLASEVKNLILAADVLFLGGLAVAATGVVLTLVLREGGPPPVTAGCGPEGCGLQVQGRF